MFVMINTLSWNRFAVNGVSIYNAVDSDEEDAYETEGKTFDACGASSDGNNRSVSIRSTQWDCSCHGIIA